MEKLFENVMLAEFASNLETFISFKARGGMRQRERLLETFFNNLIAPLLDGAEAVMEVMAMESKKKVRLAESVINELYVHIIEPHLVQSDEPTDVSFAVVLTALFAVRHANKDPFVCACRAVHIETYAPLLCPSVRPERVRTFKEELALQGYYLKLEKWSKKFSTLCNNVCKP